MSEAEQPGVQRLAGKGGNMGTHRPDASDRSPGTRAVGRIADQRVTEMGEMNPDLVGPTRGEAAFDLRRMGAETALHPIAGDRRFASFLSDHRHLFTVCAAAANIAGDLACGHCRHTPDEGGISAIDPACGKIARQRVVGRLGLGDDDKAAGALVEPMHDARSADPADAGQARAAMGQERVDESAVGVSRGGVDNHARRLVDDDQVCILKLDLERDRLCDRRGILNLRKNYDEMLVVPHAQRRIAQNRSLMGDLAGLDEALQPRARQQRQMLRQDAVEPLSGIARAGPDSDHFISGQHLPLAGLDPAIHVFIARTRLFADSNVMGGWVYILTNRRNGTLYVGSTVNLARRIWEHREGAADGFTKQYGLSRLVYAEQHTNMLSAKQREMNIKHWSRAWKIRLIHRDNPDWEDLYDRLA